MLAYLLKRLIMMFPLLLGITLVTFTVIHLAPGEPTDLQTQLNPDSGPELREKLRQKHGAAAADRAIEKLASYGYLDDEAFAADYARYLMERKHFDVRRIALELRRKGVDGETAAKTLKTLDNDPISRIIELLKTKYDGKLEEEKERKRLVNRLLRMGYTLHDIRAAFSSLDLTLPE